MVFAYFQSSSLNQHSRLLHTRYIRWATPTLTQPHLVTMNNSIAYECPEDMLARGKKQWQVICTPFFDQLSQPKWINLSKTAFNSTGFHSSQITGAITGTTKEPAPKWLLQVGLINLGIAYSNSNSDTDRSALFSRGARQLPANLREHWNNLKTMVQEPSGLVLGPLEIFAAMTGLLDLGIESKRFIPHHAKAQASLALGKELRRLFAQSNFDWIENLPSLTTSCPVLEHLLMGHTVAGEDIIDALPTLSKIVKSSDLHLWQICQQAFKTT